MVKGFIRILDWVQTRIPLRFFGVRDARIRGFRNSQWRESSATGKPVAWFHASSMGELEMLRPLLDDFVASGESVGVSVFSDSALPGLSELASRCVYAGLSPREGEWMDLFVHFGVKKLILAKYDFWPGMIHSAGILGFPVLVINARPRASFRLLHALFAFDSLPEFHLFGTTAEGPGDGSRPVILPGVDPRWERVVRRASGAGVTSEKQARLEHWRAVISQMPKPLGVIGSAWPRDLEMVLPALRGFKGSLLIVPHSLSSENLKSIEEKVGHFPEARIRIVSESGILAELYGAADFAWVGGGFGRGIHSTIEPAIYGIPIASGPARVRDFPETQELQEEGLLRILRSVHEVSLWLDSLHLLDPNPGFIEGKRARYRALLEECLRIR